jgi:hypothetical protein
VGAIKPKHFACGHYSKCDKSAESLPKESLSEKLFYFPLEKLSENSGNKPYLLRINKMDGKNET